VSTDPRPDRVEIYADASGQYRWRRKAPNGRIVADSGESYTRAGDCLEAAERVFKGQMLEWVVPERGE